VSPLAFTKAERSPIPINQHHRRVWTSSGSRQIDTLKAQTEKNPRDVTAWIDLGHQYFDGNLPDEAIAPMKKRYP
jgi:cytochrome c-type biogenesis protein CcmH/NrfG